MPKVLLAALWIANLAAVVSCAMMFAGSSWVATHPYFAYLFHASYGVMAKLIVLLSFAAVLSALVSSTKGVGTRVDLWRGLAALGIAGLVVLAVEIIGTSSGQPFGKFAYTGLLGPKAFGLVPWLVPLSWCAMAVPSYAIASALASNLEPERRFGAAAVRVGVGTLLLPMRDLTLDPAMSILTPSWIWEKPGAAQGMPLSNTLGWFATAFFIMLVFEVMRARPSFTKVPLRWHLQFYAANLMLPFGMVLAAQIWGTALLAVAFACLMAALFFLDGRPAHSAPETGEPAAATGEAMCYSALVKRDLKLLESRFGATVVRDGFEAYKRMAAEDPKAYPPEAPRIYPGHYAPVVALAGHAASSPKKTIELMRYSVDPPPYIPDPQRYTTFNARRDNLTSKFWSEAFLVHHGIVLLDGFYEWVDVKDLLKAGVVTLAQVKEEFERQAEERRKKIEDAGKKYKPTKTELTDPRLRKIVINFRPDDGDELVVPVIYSVHEVKDGHERLGFALITDDPPKEVRAAGHDRCPIALSADAVDAWMQIGDKTAAEMQEILSERRRVHFSHELAKAA